MSKKHPPSEQDRELFRNSVKGIKPLSSDKRPLSKAKKPAVHPSSFNEPLIEYFPRLTDEVGHDEPLYFARSGLQTKLLHKLKQGAMPLEAKLDCHGMKIAAAIAAMKDFLSQCQHQQARCVLIIHGKGHRSPNGKPKLKNLVNQWLRQQPCVLAFCSAKPKHGGTGAVTVLLKRQRLHPDMS